MTLDPLRLYRKSFQQAHAACFRLINEKTSPRDRGLTRLLGYALEKQTASDYPFVFRYSFCRGEASAKRAVRLSAAIHLLQSSGFVTDDVFDRSPLRYGRPAVHERFGADQAVLAAEMMQSIALEAAAEEVHRLRLPNAAEAAVVLQRISRELYQGQYLDVVTSGDPRVTRADYMRVIALAVGRYYGHVARFGALLGGRPRAEVEALTRFGFHYGMAVFITDDILDIRHKPRKAKLVAGSDLMNRRMRLPVIHALRLADRSDRVRLRRFLRADAPAGRQVYEAIARIIERSGALEACAADARAHVNAALASLVGVRSPFTRRMMAWLAATLMAAQGLDG